MTRRSSSVALIFFLTVLALGVSPRASHAGPLQICPHTDVTPIENMCHRRGLAAGDAFGLGDFNQMLDYLDDHEDRLDTLTAGAGATSFSELLSGSATGKTFTITNGSLLTTAGSGQIIATSSLTAVAQTGDSATAFFPAGQVEVLRGGTGLSGGASGGIPFFSGTSTMASSATLGLNLPVIGGGSGTTPTTGTRSGNTTTFVTTTGTQTNGRCVEIDASGNHIAAAASCGTGGGGSGNSFETMNASSGTDPVADTASDILIITGISPIVVTGDASADSLAISATVATTTQSGITQLATSAQTTPGLVVQADDTRLTNARTPLTHAASHQNGGTDEVATATPAANAIPKAGAGSTLADAWLPSTFTRDTELLFSNITGPVLAANQNTVTVLDDSVGYAADVGSTDSYAITLTPAPAGYVTGARYRFKANTVSTGAASLSVNALGGKTIKKAPGGITTDLANGDICAGQVVDVVYDGTNMQMQSQLCNAPSGSGTVNAGALNALAYYPSAGTVVDDAPVLSWDGGTLIAGTGATAAFNFGQANLTAKAAPATPTAGVGAVYVDSTSKNLSVKDDAGVIKHGVQTKTAVTNQWLKSVDATGLFSTTQPSVLDLAPSSSADLLAVLTNETGSGVAVFGTSPTFTTSITVNPTDAADAGAIRLNNNEYIAWEAAPAGVDCTFGLDATEALQSNCTLNSAILTEGTNPVPNSQDHLGFFAPTTSAQLATVLSDEFGLTGNILRAPSSSTIGHTLQVAAGPTLVFAAPGGGGGSISGTMTTGTIPKAAGATVLADSAIIEDADSVNFSKNIEGPASATPTMVLRDSNNTDAEDNVRLLANCTVTGSGAEDCDVTLDQYVDGAVQIAVKSIADGAGTLGSSQNTAWTVVTDGTGDGEFVVPAQSISGAEILNNTVTATQIDETTNYTWTGVHSFAGGSLFNGGVNAQTGTTYTVVAADENKLLTFDNAAPVAVTLPQATTAGFTNGAVFHVTNLGVGAVTITPTTSTLNGVATLVLRTGSGAKIVSNGTNYSALVNAQATSEGQLEAQIGGVNLVSIDDALTITQLFPTGQRSFTDSCSVGEAFKVGCGAELLSTWFDVVTGLHQELTTPAAVTVKISNNETYKFTTNEGVTIFEMDEATGTITVGGGGASTNSFATMNAPAGTDPVADASTDTLNLVGASPIVITGDSTTDTLTFSATVATTSQSGITQLATSVQTTPGLVVQASDTRIAPATTTTQGTVELATDGEVVANVAVQGNDTRLKRRDIFYYKYDDGVGAADTCYASSSMIATTTCPAADGVANSSWYPAPFDGTIVSICGQASSVPAATTYTATLRANSVSKALTRTITTTPQCTTGSIAVTQGQRIAIQSVESGTGGDGGLFSFWMEIVET